MERTVVADVFQVQRLWKACAEACQAGDIDGWLSLWDVAGIHMAPAASPYVGQDQIRKAVEPSFYQFIISNVIIDPEEIRIMGDRAYTYGTYSFDVRPKEGGEPVGITGQFLDILAKQPDGSWRIAINCHNHYELCSFADALTAEYLNERRR